MMYGVAWAQMHSTSFAIDQNVSFECFVSFGKTLGRKLNSRNVPKLLNVVLIEESNFMAVLSS